MFLSAGLKTAPHRHRTNRRLTPCGDDAPICDPAIRTGAARGVVNEQLSGRGATEGGSKTGAQPTIDGSTYIKPQEMDWAPTQFTGISIKVLYEDK